MALTKSIPVTFPEAVQVIAAVEDRLAWMRQWPGDFTPEITAMESYILQLRTAFDIYPRDAAGRDAAHEWMLTDGPTAYDSRADEYRTRGA